MLETTIAERWLREYASKEIDDIGRRLEMERAELEYEQRISLNNGIHVLANMHKYYVNILLGKNPNLTAKYAKLVSGVLADFRRLMPPHWMAVEYPSVVPALEEALAGIRVYVSHRNSRKVLERAS